MKKIARTFATIAFILSVLYLIYLYITVDQSASANEISLSNQFTAHIVSVGLAFLMNGVGLVFNSRNFVLAGAFFYVVAILQLPGNLFFVAVQALLSVVAFIVGKPERDQFI